MKRIKIPRLFKPKKILATTARRASAAGMEFEGIPEPNMKLSRALLIVLLLHVVAVSGIIAFNAIKTREGSLVPPNSAQAANDPADTSEKANHTGINAPGIAATQDDKARPNDAKPSHSLAKEQRPTAPGSSGKTYVVKKGDTPVTIAKRLKVSYDDLMLLNHIEDPRKLRIGQKLLIPERTNSTTASAKATNHKKKTK
jgi:LysM repeat protein